MLVRELIGGEVGACEPKTPVLEAADRMVARDVGSLAVVETGAIVGIITERDIVRALATGELTKRTRVGRVMTPSPDSLSPDIEVEDASAWMLAAGYRHLPIVEGGRLLGMVSIKDLLWAVTEPRYLHTDEGA